MKALIQRVLEASVKVDGKVVGEINRGLLVLLGIEKGDTQVQAEWMVKKLLSYRVFPDENGKMNCNICEVDGDILLVSQFTLAADTNSGNRPSFTPAAEHEEAKYWYEFVEEQLSINYKQIQTGVFAADMKVSLTNDGPVTFLLQR